MRHDRLIVQPLVENSIYHGMEYMDGDGRIFIHAYVKEAALYIEIEDNGPGMTQEQVDEPCERDFEIRQRERLRHRLP